MLGKFGKTTALAERISLLKALLCVCGLLGCANNAQMDMMMVNADVLSDANRDAACIDSQLSLHLEDWAVRFVDFWAGALREQASQGLQELWPRRVVVRPAWTRKNGRRVSCAALGDSMRDQLHDAIKRRLDTNRVIILNRNGSIKPLQLVAEGADMEINVEWEHDSKGGRDFLVVSGRVYTEADEDLYRFEKFSVDACGLTDRQRKCLLP